MRTLLRNVAILLTAVFGSSSTHARIAPADYRDVRVSVSARAFVPLNVDVTDLEGRQRTMRELISRPTVLVFADYTCRTLCGPILDFVASALEKSGLRAGRDFRLLVIGLDPKDTANDAAKMRRAHLSAESEVDRATAFVTAESSIIEKLTTAVGYHYRYDAADDLYIHPAAAYVLTRDGHVTRVLTGIGLSGPDMRLALVEAGDGKVGTFRDQVRLLCSAFDPSHGAYNLVVWRLLEFSAAVTIIFVGGGIGLLLLAGRRHAA